MGAAVADRDQVKSEGRYQYLLVAGGAVIYFGVAVGLDAAGYAAPMADDADLTFIGVARGAVNNSAGASAAVHVEVDTEGVFSFDGTGFAQADVGKAVYALTDQDVGLITTVENDRYVGTLVEVLSSTKVRVKINSHASPTASDVADVESAVVDVLVDVALLQAQVTTLEAERVDVQIPISLVNGIADGGGWAPGASTDGLLGVTRSVATPASSYWLEIATHNRTTADKGIKPTGLSINYEVNAADAADVRFELWKGSQGANGAPRSAALLFGEADAHYDDDHNTAVLRSASTANPEFHTCVISDPGAPAYLAAGERLLLRCFVDGDAGPASVVTVTQATLLASEARVDTA